MRSLPANTLAVLQNAPENGISVRDFVYIETVQGAIGYGFYSDIEPAVTVPVIDGTSGLTVNREYFGDGALQGISDIKLTVGLDVYTININLSNIHPKVNELIRGYDVAHARIEIHRGVIDPATGELADPPQLHFIGTVNKAVPSRPAVGGGGAIAITATSFTNELTRTNPAKFSDATISRRNGDRFCRYIDIMGDVRLHWGAEGPASGTNGGGGSGKEVAAKLKEFLTQMKSSV